MGMQAAIGQVWSARSPNGPRALVFIFDLFEDCVEVALCHSFPELATDHDLILPPTACGLPYTLVVETDIVGPILESQLHACLGSLPTAIVPACWQGACTSPHLRGLPIQGRADARWGFKLTELERLHACCASAMRRLLD
jgi:hypothetical protein